METEMIFWKYFQVDDGQEEEGVQLEELRRLNPAQIKDKEENVRRFWKYLFSSGLIGRIILESVN